MSKTPWTPGPWRVDAPDKLQGFEFIPVQAGLGENIADVCSLFDDEGVPLGITAQDEANACLIAAAPEMAEVLEELCNIIEAPVASYEEAVSKARALLARIRGETP